MVSTTALDYAGVAALLTVIGSGLWKLWTSWFSRADRRQKELEDREHALDEQRDHALKAQTERIEAMDARLRILERGYHALAGVTHALVDELVQLKPDAVSFALIERSVRMHFPVPDEMPPELVSLLKRIEEVSTR